MESPTVGTPPKGHTTQVSVEASEEVALTTPSLAVEVPAEMTPPEVPVASLALDVSTVSTTLAQKEPACTPFYHEERGASRLFLHEGRADRRYVKSKTGHWRFRRLSLIHI